MTGGGPASRRRCRRSTSSSMFTARQNVGQGMAAATMMLLPVAGRPRRAVFCGSGGASARGGGAHDRRQHHRDRRRPAATRSAASSRAGRSRKRISPARIGLYAFLIVSALYFLIPLYVMIVTSLKGMPEIRLGNIFPCRSSSPSSPGSRPGCTPAPASTATASARLLELGQDHRAERRSSRSPIASVNGYALANWRFKGSDFFFTILLVRLVHPLPGDALSAGHHHCARWASTARCRASSSCTRSSACRS